MTMPFSTDYDERLEWDMADAISFVVPGEPVAQPRQRHGVRKIRGRLMSAPYRDDKHPVHTYKQAVQLSARTAHQGDVLAGPVRLVVEFVFPRPAYMTWKRKAMPRVLHTAKPDNDNLIKAVKDALNGAVWRDDAQVCSESIDKFYAAGDEQPHTLIIVMPLEQTQ